MKNCNGDSNYTVMLLHMWNAAGFSSMANTEDWPIFQWFVGPYSGEQQHGAQRGPSASVRKAVSESSASMKSYLGDHGLCDTGGFNSIDPQRRAVFTFVREPLERFISGYAEVESTYRPSWLQSAERGRFARAKMFIDRFFADGADFNGHVKPQSEFFVPPSSDCGMAIDFVGKSEHMSEDWHKFMERKHCDAASIPYGQHPMNDTVKDSWSNLLKQSLLSTEVSLSAEAAMKSLRSVLQANDYAYLRAVCWMHLIDYVMFDYELPKGCHERELLHIYNRARSLDGQRETCDAVLLGDLRPKAEKGYRQIRLTPRSRAARLVDTFAYGSNFELEELLLRLYEMGDDIDEFHIVEGDRDFTGAKKPFYLVEVLESGQLDRWKNKIWHHKIRIPKGMHGYTLQRLQRGLMEEEMGLAQYRPDDVILAGDLDEIVSRTALKALKHCQPEPDGDQGVVEWNTHIQMSTYMYDLKWTRGNFRLPTTVTFFNELQRYLDMTKADQAPEMPLAHQSLFRLQSVYARPREIRLKDERPAGWHVSFVLNGTAGIAHKYFIRIEDRPEWAKDFKTEAEMEEFMNEHFLKNPPDYDTRVFPSNLKKRDFPEAAIEHPQKFPTILRDVVW